jgi:hypothetical protein
VELLENTIGSMWAVMVIRGLNLFEIKGFVVVVVVFKDLPNAFFHRENFV